MQSGYLTPDAFAKAADLSESKSQADDYKSLYGDSPVITEYAKPKKDEAKEVVLKRQQFQEQFGVLMDALEKWGKANGYTQAQMVSINGYNNPEEVKPEDELN